MADINAPTTTASDPTFRSYDPVQAKLYAEQRREYAGPLIETVVEGHLARGGALGLVLDVGCGPGNSTRGTALCFDAAVGVDPGVQMIEAAKDKGGRTRASADISFAVCPAEELSTIPDLAPGSVDLLTAAMAAHWFRMDEFWAEAAKVVKPGGTVALWTKSSFYCENASEINKVLLRFERETLAPYEMPGNRLSRDMYDALPLPWQVTPAVGAFQEADFQRLEFDRDGVLSDPAAGFFGSSTADAHTDLAELEVGMRTASMVTRWREANPALVDTERDALRVFIAELRAALGGKSSFQSGCSTAILFFTRRADS